jgi:glycosyltransferase involved in cell wall biosynthesis
VYCQPLPASRREDGVVPAVVRHTWKLWLPGHGWRCRTSIVHFHDGWFWAPAAWAMVRLGRAVVMTFHDQQAGGPNWRAASWLERRFSRRLIRDPRVRWIAVSREVKQQLMGKGVSESRIAVIPAYIPPPAAPGGPGLPGYVTAFLQSRAPVLSTYAWKLTVDEQGIDVYGFDLCIEAVRALRAEHPQIGLVVSLPQVADRAYFDELKRRIATAGLEENVLFVTEPLDDIHRLWQASDVHLRATNTDGDAVTVREALSLQVPVVASDASPRPEGAVLFPARNLAAMLAALRQVLADRPRRVEALRSIRIPDNFPPLLDVYRELARCAHPAA